MNKNRILLSVIVPTKNRYEYLKDCIKTISTIDNGSIELIVQDNSDNNEDIIKFIEGLNYTNLKYFYTKEHLSVIENCDLALKNSTGEFVCMLGDDDTVASKIVDVVKWMKENTVESCLGTIVRYNWPDLVFKHHKYHSMIIPEINNNIREISLKDELEKCLYIGAQTMNKLPKVYHAIVSRKALERVYKKTGSYFPGSSPDMANAVALACSLKNHIILEYPIIISGFSYKSTGGQGTRGTHVGNIEDMKHLPKDTCELWNEKIPYIWTAETIYADSVISSLKRMGENEKLESFNFINHYAAFVCYNSSLSNIVFPYIRKSRQWFKFTCYILKIMSRRGKNFILNTLESKFGFTKKTVFDNIESLEDALSTVDEYNQKKSLENILNKYKTGENNE